MLFQWSEVMRKTRTHLRGSPPDNIRKAHERLKEVQKLIDEGSQKLEPISRELLPLIRYDS